jgi:hypothetical protein
MKKQKKQRERGENEINAAVPYRSDGLVLLLTHSAEMFIVVFYLEQFKQVLHIILGVGP